MAKVDSMKRGRGILIGAMSVSCVVLSAWLWNIHAQQRARGFALEAGAFLQAKKFPEAAAALEQYLRVQPDDVQSTVLLADVYSESNHHEQAAAAWNRLAGNPRRRGEALRRAGEASFRAGMASAAEQSLRDCFEMDVPFELKKKSAYELANIYWASDREADLMRIADLFARYADSRNAIDDQLAALVWMMRARMLDVDSDDGMKEGKRWTQADDNDYLAHCAYARHLADLNRGDEARNHALHALSLAPDRLWAWDTAISCFLRLGEAHNARQLLDLFPDPAASSWLALLDARCSLQLGDRSRAETQFRHYLKDDPRNTAALAGLNAALQGEEHAVERKRIGEQLDQLYRTTLDLRLRYLQLRQGYKPSADESVAIAELCESAGYPESWHWRRRAARLDPSRAAQFQTTATLQPIEPRPTRIAWDGNRAAIASLVQQMATETEIFAGIVFDDVTTQAGVDFSYFRGDSKEFWITEPNGGAVAWLDVDLDGWQDLFFTNGRSQFEPRAPVKNPAGALFLNRTHYGAPNAPYSKFEEVAATAGIVREVHAQGCAVGDYDQDGYPDLFVTSYGPCVLYQNQGDGTFRDVTRESGIAGEAFFTGAAFCDPNCDGNVDLFVVTYVDFDPTLHGKPCENQPGVPEYCGPRCCPGKADLLYLNPGDGVFRDVSNATGIDQSILPGFTVVSADFDNDDWPDFYVANDSQPNALFLNRAKDDPANGLRFENVAAERACALNTDGVAQGSMGVACADVNQDGYLDLGVSNYYQEHFTYYRNSPGGYFEDRSIPDGVAAPTRRTMGWGCHFFDFDNNGSLDLFVANGHINPFADGRTAMPPQLFRNNGRHRFVEVGAPAGSYLATPRVARGSAIADYNNDGRIDLAVLNHHEPSVLLKNASAGEQHAVMLALVGRISNRDAVYSRLTIEYEESESGSRTRVRRDIVGGGSYLSADDRRVHVGVPAAVTRVAVTVKWPSGMKQTWNDVAARGTAILIESDDRVAYGP